MANRKLGRVSSQRKALLRDLVSDFIINEQIVTTLARAKETQRLAEKLVTLGKRGDLAARRQAAKIVRNEIASFEETEDAIIVENVLQKLFDTIAPRYADRNGGYTRVLKMEPRRGDAAPMALLQFVEASVETEDAEEETAEA